MKKCVITRVRLSFDVYDEQVVEEAVFCIHYGIMEALSCVNGSEMSPEATRSYRACPQLYFESDLLCFYVFLPFLCPSVACLTNLSTIVLISSFHLFSLPPTPAISVFISFVFFSRPFRRLLLPLLQSSVSLFFFSSLPSRPPPPPVNHVFIFLFLSSLPYSAAYHRSTIVFVSSFSPPSFVSLRPPPPASVSLPSCLHFIHRPFFPFVLRLLPH